MKKIIILAGLVVVLLTSCAAQQRYTGSPRTKPLPARGYNNPYERERPRSNSTVQKGVAVGAGILIGAILYDRLFTPRWGAAVCGGGGSYEDPNLWHARPGYPWYPGQLGNRPYYYYPTPNGNFGYYRGTRVCMGVNLQQQIVIVCGDQTLSVWDARTGGCLANVRLYAGYHSHLQLNTPSGARQPCSWLKQREFVGMRNTLRSMTTSISMKYSKVIDFLTTTSNVFWKRGNALLKALN